METQSTQIESTKTIWESEAEARMLENRLNGFWNADYFTKILLPLLDLKPGNRVLDVGAGTGALTLLLARHLPKVQFVGVDLTAAMVTDAQVQAQKLGIPNVEFVEGDALSLPFEDESFDAVVCQTVLIHLGDPAGAVGEMSRVLKPGGTFMAAEYHTLFCDLPIEADRLQSTDDELSEQARFTKMIVQGYRTTGQGDLKLGGQVPFLAVNAGLRIVDVRINDRVSHAFPPYDNTAQMGLAELQGFESLTQDPGYQAWLKGALVAGGGTEADFDAFFNLFRRHSPEAFAGKTDFSFVWLLNPVLLVTVARKG